MTARRRRPFRPRSRETPGVRDNPSLHLTARRAAGARRPSSGRGSARRVSP